MKKYILLFFILNIYFLSVYCEDSIEIYISDIIIESNDVNSGSISFYSIIKESLSGIGDKKFEFHLLSNLVKEDSVIKKENIKNDYMAFEICDILGIDYLVYGRLEIYEFHYIELKLFGKKENKTILRISKRKENVTDLSRFLEEIFMDMDNKVHSEISFDKKKGKDNVSVKTDKDSDKHKEDIKEKQKTEEDKKTKNTDNKKLFFSDYISIYNGIGYNVVLPDYSSVYTGVIGFETGISFVRLNLKTFNNFTIFIKPSFVFSYYISISKEEFVQSYFTNFQFKTDLSFGVNIFRFFDITSGVGVGLELDLLYQKYLNFYPYYLYPAFLTSFIIDFLFWIDKDRCIGLGLKNEFNLVFHSDFYGTYKPVIYCAVRFKGRRQ